MCKCGHPLHLHSGLWGHCMIVDCHGCEMFVYAKSDEEIEVERLEAEEQEERHYEEE